jgi:hypothetical protein
MSWGVFVLSLLGVVFLAFIGFLFFCLTAVVAGERDYSYRCVNGVMEAQPRYWGIGIGSSQPIDADPVGGCSR